MTESHIAFPENENPSHEPALGEAVMTPEAEPLYPAVQTAMDSLHRVAMESAEAADIQYTASGEPILTPGIMQQWANEVGFVGKTGTYCNEGADGNGPRDVYLYTKYCHDIPVEADIDTTLATARELTARGAIHPESQWGVQAMKDGTHYLFVVAPALEPYSYDKDVSGEYASRVARPMRDNSHILDLYARIDPEFSRDKPIPEGSLLYHFNYTEASHPDNWGWDKTGALYPVDVEVIRPHTSRMIMNPEPWVQNLFPLRTIFSSGVGIVWANFGNVHSTINISAIHLSLDGYGDNIQCFGYWMK